MILLLTFALCFLQVFLILLKIWSCLIYQHALSGSPGSPVTRTTVLLHVRFHHYSWHTNAEIFHLNIQLTWISNILRIYKLANSCIIWATPSLQNLLFSMRKTAGNLANGKICQVMQVIRTLWNWICLRLWTTNSEWLLLTAWVRAGQAGHQPATRPVEHVSD